ncbi:MAG TPA: methyltransferase domain-containing protein [Pyrinomonadaceae bacterium]|jgi:ubiquinone/menaquinone biosynthesis C-methylase UbiE|nr:methyltransferase domain-containing protein [Pyrinomonadaceae bacterium]
MKEPEQSEIAAAYNDWAETYDDVPNRTRDLAAEALRQIGLDLEGRKVVEVGCGTGRNTTWLAERAAELVGIDFSEAMLARARIRVNDPRVRFVQHDVNAVWPLAAASADVVIAMLILEHVEHLEKVFLEVARVLRSGGQFLLCELHPIRQLAGAQAQFNNIRTGEHQCVTAFLHDVSDYVNVALASGFELQHMGEWRDAEAPPSGDPRVLSLLFRKR